MVKVFRNGLTAPNTTVTGATIWPKVMALSITRMVMYMMENFYRIEQTAMVFIFIRMDRNMKASGLMICKKARGKSCLKMGRSMLAYSKMGKSKGMVLMNGQIKAFMLGAGLIII